MLTAGGLRGTDLLVVQLYNENSDYVVAQISCMSYNLVINWCSVGNQRALSR